MHLPANRSALRHFEIDGANIIRIFGSYETTSIRAGEKEIILDVLVRELFLGGLKTSFEIPEIYRDVANYSFVGELEIGISVGGDALGQGKFHQVLADEQSTYLLFRRFLAQKRFKHIDNCIKESLKYSALFLDWIAAERELYKTKLSKLDTLEITSNIDNLNRKLEAISSTNENIDTKLSEIQDVSAEIFEKYAMVVENVKAINMLIDRHNWKLKDLLNFNSNPFPGIHDQLAFGKTIFGKYNSLAYERMREHRKESHLYDE